MRRLAPRLAASVALLVAIAAAPAARGAARPSVKAVGFTVHTTLDPVDLEARYYRPSTKGTYPVVLFAHGGGNTLDEWADRAAAYAADGFVAVVWSARGHGNSGGFYDLFGPKTVRDTKDVLDWVLRNADRTGADAGRVGIVGYSQGGGTTNLAAAFDPRIRAIAPGHTFSGLRESLTPNDCLKLSTDLGILTAAYNAKGARLDQTLVARWTAYTLTGAGRDQVLADWEARSPRRYVSRITQPSLWVQAFDDPLFPVDQALLMNRLESNPRDRLWLAWGGHFSAGSTTEEVDAREGAWHQWMQHWLRGDDNGADRAPRVTWWFKAADRSRLVREGSPSWPPPGTVATVVPLAAGQVASAGGAQGTHEDPVAQLASRSAPGDVVSRLPNHTPLDTLVTATKPLAEPSVFAGAAHADLRWAATAPTSQVNVKVWDVGPDGSGTLLGRACRTVVSAVGATARVSLDLWPSAVEVPAGHHLEVWVQPADAPTFEPSALPFVATVGAGSSVTVPLLPKRRLGR